MEPLYLKPDELNYELAIRGIFNVESQLLKTRKLRELLRSESDGLLVAPTSISSLYTASVEIEFCRIIYKDIIQLFEQRDRTELTSKKCASRLRHLGQRINRIQPTAEIQKAHLRDLGHWVSDALIKVEGHRNKSVNNHNASNSAIPLEVQLGAQALPPVPNNLVNNIPQNSNAHNVIDLVEQHDMCGVDRRYSYSNDTSLNLTQTSSRFRELTNSIFKCMEELRRSTIVSTAAVQVAARKRPQ